MHTPIAAPNKRRNNHRNNHFTPTPEAQQRSQVMVELAKRANLIDLIGRFTTLRRESAAEWSGPCPRCLGTDRLHCTATWWFCANCSQGSRAHRGDAIEFIQFVNGCGFREAVDYLTGGAMSNVPPQPTTRPPVRPPTPPAPTDHWQTVVGGEIHTAHERLMDSQPTDAHAAYLLSRNIEPHTWQAYRLGAARVVSRDDGKPHDAILIPWFRQGQPCAVRYRFIAPPGPQKTTSRPGSIFAARLWGGQALPGGVESLRTLVLCEGELNAASIWQVGHDLGFDVLSLGSEAQRITDAMLTYARRFAHVIVWMDKGARVNELIAKIPGAVGIAGPGDNDANDLLIAGVLQATLCDVRLVACKDDVARERLLWDIWDGARLPTPLGNGVWQFAVALAAKLGRDIAQGRP